MAKPNTFFKLTEGNGTTACTVLIRPAEDMNAVTPLNFKENSAGDYVASQTLADALYYIEWVMLSGQGGTMQIDISDTAGKPVRGPIKDTNKTGKPFKWNANQFKIGAAAGATR